MKVVFAKALMFLGLLSTLACTGDEYVEPDAALEVEGVYRGLYNETGKNLVIGVDVEIKRLEKNKISIKRANAENTFTPEFDVEIKKLTTGVTSILGSTYTVSLNLPQSAGEATELSFNDSGNSKIYLDGIKLSEVADITKDVIGTYKGTYVKGATIDNNAIVVVTKKSNTVVQVSPAQGKAFPAPFEVDLYKVDKIGTATFNQLREAVVSGKKVSITFDLTKKEVQYTNFTAGGEGFDGVKQ
jgi:hypothetical protein